MKRRYTARQLKDAVLEQVNQMTSFDIERFVSVGLQLPVSRDPKDKTIVIDFDGANDPTKVGKAITKHGVEVLDKTPVAKEPMVDNNPNAGDNTPVLGKEQQEAFDYIMDNPQQQFRMIFLTGEAGTGKSFLVNHIRKHANCAMTASTGIAAQNIKGGTIHSFLGLNIVTMRINLMRLEKNIARKQIVVLDEVSMINRELFEGIVSQLSRFPVTLLMVGDFFQLPPVKGDYCFMSPEWGKVAMLNMTENFRQAGDVTLQKALNALCVGDMHNEALRNLLQERSVPEIPDDVPVICPHRVTADSINKDKLERLNTKIYSHTAKVIVDNVYDADKAIKKTRIPLTIQFAVGARVIFLENSTSWVNGSTGVITRITGMMVQVRLDDGRTVTTSPTDHDVLDSNGELTLLFRQYPFQLAWAVTIHKSQGMSLAKVGIHMDNHFAPGMTYVAASRCTSKEGLFLVGTNYNVNTDPMVLKYFGQFRNTIK